jgi:23S rRNA (guanosine2251-2'-O)-methyltransferase
MPPATLYDVDLTGPVAWVLGAEGTGLRQLTRKTWRTLVRIPMSGAVESLNVSVASAVRLSEALRQRRVAGVWTWTSETASSPEASD